jgi:hypothetical protein
MGRPRAQVGSRAPLAAARASSTATRWADPAKDTRVHLSDRPSSSRRPRAGREDLHRSSARLQDHNWQLARRYRFVVLVAAVQIDELRPQLGDLQIARRACPDGM